MRPQVAGLDEETAALVSGISAAACLEAQDCITRRLAILRMHRELHTAEVQLEVEEHNRSLMLGEAPPPLIAALPARQAAGSCPPNQPSRRHLWTILRS